jgi:hypothetical protein
MGEPSQASRATLELISELFRWHKHGGYSKVHCESLAGLLRRFRFPSPLRFKTDFLESRYLALNNVQLEEENQARRRETGNVCFLDK